MEKKKKEEERKREDYEVGKGMDSRSMEDVHYSIFTQNGNDLPAHRLETNLALGRAV